MLGFQLYWIVIGSKKKKKSHKASYYLVSCSYNQTSEWLPTSEFFIEVVASTARKSWG